MSAFATLLLLLGQAAAPVPFQADDDIVITARPLAETERDWKQCRKRNCPPEQEIAAAIAHGENLFVAGDYRRSRSVLAQTIDSTRGAEQRYPVAVGDLRRAEARVSMHMGEDVLVRRGMLAARDAMARGLDEADPRVLAQRLQVADAIMLEPLKPWYVGDARPFITDKRRVALRTYEAVVRAAHKADLPDIEGRALIRKAALLSGLAMGEREYEDRAREAIERIAATTDPRLAVYREAARLLDIKMAAAKGDAAAVERLIASFSGRSSRLLILLYAPPIDWSRSADRRASIGIIAVAQNTLRETDYGHNDQWIDVAFRIRPDGRVEDVEVLRQSSDDLTDWVAPVAEAVALRRYAPMAGDQSGGLRVERHTYTASNSFATGSRVRQQNGIPRVVVTDMALEPAVAATGPGTGRIVPNS